MAGYPPAGYPPTGYGYGYGAPSPYPPPNPYGGGELFKPDKLHYQATVYGAPAMEFGMLADPYGAPAVKPGKREKQQYGGGGGYGSMVSPFAALVPSVFPPGTDPAIVSGFQMADQDRSGFIDDMELQRALSGYNQSFSLRTVQLLMYLFTNSNLRKIGTQLH